MTKQIDHIIDKAVAQGLVDGAVLEADRTAHPWPVVLMTAFMTFLAALPICGLLFMVFLENSSRTASVIIGLVVAGAAAAVLRIRQLPLFLEYLCVAMLGSGLIVVLEGDHGARGLALSGLLALGLAAAVPQPWIRALLAAVSALELVFAFGKAIVLYGDPPAWPGCQLAALAWLGLQLALMAFERKGNYAAAAWMESLVIGSGAAIISLLAYASGSTFLVSGLVHDGMFGRADAHPFWMAEPWISAAMAGLAAAWLFSLGDTRPYRAWLLAVTPIVAVLSWFASSLGALSLIIVACLAWHRPRFAVLASVAALWSIGALYYSLDWPLLYKSVVMLAVGSLLFASTRLLGRAAPGAPRFETGEPAHARPWAAWGLVVPAVLVLAMTNVGIWQKEQTLRQGTTVFVELGPVDPRSLMQGDYMTLAFALPPVPENGPASDFVVARRDNNDVATLARYHDGKTPLAPDEILIQVKHSGTGQVLVTNAWFFQEGEGQRWAGARYGEFRVDRDGKAVLVGLRGPKLEKL